MRTTLYSNQELTICCDHINNKIILHIDFKKSDWSHRFAKKIRWILKNLERHFKSEGVNELWVAPKKDHFDSIKLAELYGFVEVYSDDNLHLMKKIIN